MNITSRPFSGEKDLQLLKDFVTAVMANDMYHSYWHVGDLLWGMYQNTIFNPFQSIRLWENEDGELLGFAWLDWREVTIQASPRLEGNDLNDLLEQMLAWGEECQRASLKGRDAGRATPPESFGMQTAILKTFGDNEAARSLYESVGFRTFNKLYGYRIP